jgi:hypothetical protein
MPHDIFVSHVEEDAGVAIELAQELERAGFTTWYYERDCLPGPDYLLQVPVAIDQSRVVVVVISPHSLSSNQVTSEIVKAYEARKSFVPLLLGITHAEFQQRQPVWRQALGASTSLSLPTSELAAVFPRIIAGVRALLAAPVGASSTAAPLLNTNDPYSRATQPVGPPSKKLAAGAELSPSLILARDTLLAEVQEQCSKTPTVKQAAFERLKLSLELLGTIHHSLQGS